MELNASKAKLQQIDVHSIDRNPENPRVFFRQAELDTLQESIRKHGIQVPISVFRRGRHFILIDGERRWRCARRLNLDTLPALVQDEPDRLTNVLLMFNIHALREQWDLLTIAAKLPSVIELLTEKEGRRPTEAEISAETGLNRSTIRRCKLLIELPETYREEMLAELQKPKAQQKVTEDFFIEMERALKTVERNMPEVIPDKNEVRDVLIQKYRKNIIKDIIDFRRLPKIAKAGNVGADDKAAGRSLRKIFSSNTYSIEEGFEDTVAFAYVERGLISRITSIQNQLSQLKTEDIDEALIDALGGLRQLISRLLRSVS